MPRRALQPCRAPGCAALVESGYCAQHTPDVKREDNRPSAAARGYSGSWDVIRAAILARDPTCRDPYGEHKAAGVTVLSTDVDHIIPKRDGGLDTDDNLQGLCHHCHSRKTRAGS